MAHVLCVDFDDTLLENNLTRGIFERFAGPGWREVGERYALGEISVEEYNAGALRFIEATEEDVIEYAREHAKPRSGIRELVAWCSWHEWQVVVVSNSFDLVVNAILEDLGLERVICHAGRARKRYRWQVRYESPRGIEIHASFKLSYVQAFHAAGDLVAYAGDGASDLEAAKEADVVFARSTLLEELEGRSANVYPFATFAEIQAVMAQEGDRWYESFCSSTAGEV